MRPFVILFMVLCVLVGIEMFILKMHRNVAEANEQVEQYRNTLGQQVTKVFLITENMKSKDSLIVALQKKIKSGSGMAAHHSTVTKETASGKSTVKSKDTLRVDSLVYIYPEYSDTIQDRWKRIEIVANKDSVKANVWLKNEFNYEQNGNVISVTNLNPSTSTEIFRIVLKEPKKPKRGLYFGLGIAVTILTGIFVIR